ncbi:MAG TPA: DEAD/DEAH box helicase [Thermodesulfobacteriota bacterium]|nr:DEAD/DEAH box helicase [Thermodesulfobacteriota bacterium]
MNWDDPILVFKALVLLHSFQTVTEQVSGETIERNYAGFNAIDSPVMTSIVEWINGGKPVTEKQFNFVAKTIKKYQGQFDVIDLDRINLPETFRLVEAKQSSNNYQGRVYFSNETLYFEPYIFPTAVVKEIGFKWEKPAWKKYPAYPEDLEKLFNLFSHALIDPSVENLTKKDIAKDGFIYPTKIMAHQIEATGFLVYNPKSLLALSPGLGKSACALFAAKRLGGKTLIVCPVSLMYNWKREIKKWIGETENIEIWHGVVRLSVPWTITNYETIVGQWTDWDEIIDENSTGKPKKKRINWRCIVEHDYDNLIVDESLMIKNRKAIRSNAISTLAGSFKRVWLLSGAPTSRTLDDLFMQFRTIDPKRFSSYWKFAKEYCHVIQNQWGWQILSNKPEAYNRIKKEYSNIFFARTMEQVLPDIPDWIIEAIEIPMNKIQFKHYREIQEELKTELPNGDIVLAQNILVKILRWLQVSSNPVLIGGENSSSKWDSAKELLQFVDFPIIIWTSFLKTASLFTKELRSLKLKVAPLTGETPPSVRDKIVTDFQNGNLDVIIAHPGVGKYGHTLTACRTAIYLERDYNGDNFYQSMYRIKRIGTNHSPYVVKLLATKPDGDTNTIDCLIDQVLHAKSSAVKKLTTGMIRELLYD